jgi:two-component system, OmpR family, response regulator MprA
VGAVSCASSMSGSLPTDDQLVVLAGLDERLASAMAAAFAERGFGTLSAERARVEAAVRGRRVSAVVLDASVGVLEALDVCRRLHSSAGRVPIVALAADAVDARVALLEAGADDCVSKPFAPHELIARVCTVQRRASRNGDGQGVVSYADLRVDLEARRVWRGEREVELTRTEFALLAALAAHPDHVRSRRDLLVTVWGYDFGPEFHSLGVYVGYLRKKLEEDGESRLLHTVRGVGYVLRDKQQRRPPAT